MNNEKDEIKKDDHSLTKTSARTTLRIHRSAKV